MLFMRTCWLAALLATVGIQAREQEAVRRVAVVGAGAAGASAAYYLRQFADEDGVAVNITVFEKADHIGGRTLTVNAYNYSALPVELGASIFIKINRILWDSIDAFNLTLKNWDDDLDGVLGVWDGDQFVYTQNESSSSWWNLAKLFWKYGLAPYRANKLMQGVVAQFLNIYEAPYFPFRSLTTRAYELELTQVTGHTGEQFLGQNNVAGLFPHDIIQASTRVNYASNLAKIHGLDTMVALAPEGAAQVDGGNWQIFASMVRASKADFRPSTAITKIALVPGTVPPASQYVLKTKSTKAKSTAAAENEEEATESLEFDNVVIAAPFQYSGIEAADNVLQHVVDEIPYVKLHVTLFTSPLALSPEFFKLPPGSTVPTTVLTTLGADDDASSGKHGAGKAGFFSISTLRTLTNPKTGRKEYLYKIFSPDKVTSAFLSDLLGVDIPDTLVTPSAADTTAEVISWYYPHVFHSYPQAFPRVTFQDPILGDGLYYTSGIESFISTMETSALMGKNVARLIVDDIQGLRTGGAVKTSDGAAADEL